MKISDKAHTHLVLNFHQEIDGWWRSQDQRPRESPRSKQLRLGMPDSRSMETSLEDHLMMKKMRMRRNKGPMPERRLREIQERAGLLRVSSAMISRPIISTLASGSALG